MITIKKYPNRRLYDTSQSRYINMDVVKALIRRDQSFVVQDSKAGEDITRQILMQIICENESRPHSGILPRALLKQLIREYGSDHQQLLRKHLETALAGFLEESSRGEAAAAIDADEAVSNGSGWHISHADPAPLEERPGYLAAASRADVSG